MTYDAGRLARWALVPLMIVALAMTGAEAAVKPRAVLVVAFDASGLERDEQWMGQGIAELIALGFDQHPAFVQVEDARVRAVGRPEVWGEPVVVQAARTLRADAAVFGRITRTGAELIVQPRLVRAQGRRRRPGVAGAGHHPRGRAAGPPGAAGRRLRAHHEGGADRRRGARGWRRRASRRARSRRSSCLARGRWRPCSGRGRRATSRPWTCWPARSRPIRTSWSRSTRSGPSTRRSATAGRRPHSSVPRPSSTPPTRSRTRRWATCSWPQPRRLFDQAVEAYNKAIELRPFYADAYVGLGDAKAAKSDVDGAVAAYTKALAYNPINPRVHMSLGKIYYTEKGLYYESVTAYKKAIDLDVQLGGSAHGPGRGLRGQGALQGSHRRIPQGDRAGRQAHRRDVQPRPRLREDRTRASRSPSGSGTSRWPRSFRRRRTGSTSPVSTSRSSRAR